MAWHREVEFLAGMGDVWASHLHGPVVFYHPSVEAKTRLLSMSGHRGDLATANSETEPPRHIVACLVRFGEEAKCVAGDIF